MNNIKFAGTVGSKVEMRYTPEGKAVLNFSVSLYTGGNKEKGYNPAVWFRVSAFDELAEHLNQSVQEKQRVTVTGSMQPLHEWTGKDGVVHNDIQVIAREVVQGDKFNPDALNIGADNMEW